VFLLTLPHEDSISDIFSPFMRIIALKTSLIQKYPVMFVFIIKPQERRTTKKMSCFTAP
jgi:hypothetical protein